MGSLLPGPHLLGWHRADRTSGYGTACGQQVEACPHRCCLSALPLPGFVLLPPALSTTASATAYLTVTPSPLLPVSLPVPLPTLCSKRQRPILGRWRFLTQLPIAVFEVLAKKKYQVGIPDGKSHEKNRVNDSKISSFLFLNLHVSVLQWKEKLQVIRFPDCRFRT